MIYRNNLFTIHCSYVQCTYIRWSFNLVLFDTFNMQFTYAYTYTHVADECYNHTCSHLIHLLLSFLKKKKWMGCHYLTALQTRMWNWFYQDYREEREKQSIRTHIVKTVCRSVSRVYWYVCVFQADSRSISFSIWQGSFVRVLSGVEVLHMCEHACMYAFDSTIHPHMSINVRITSIMGCAHVYASHMCTYTHNHVASYYIHTSVYRRWTYTYTNAYHSIDDISKECEKYIESEILGARKWARKREKWEENQKK